MNGPCDPKKLYDDGELVEILGKSKAWFQRERWKGTGPAYVKVGRTPKYLGSVINEYLAAKTQSNTGQKG